MVTGVREKYLTSLNIGHFWSQMTRVSEYVELLHRLEQSAHHNTVNHNILFIDTVIHAIILDFMAWSAQLMGCYHEMSTPRKDALLRQFLLNDIEVEMDEVFCNNGIKETFLLIARLIRPVNDPIKRALSSH